MYFEDYPQSFHGAQQSLYYLLKELNREIYDPIVVCPFEGVFTKKLSEIGVDWIILSPSSKFNQYDKAILKSSIFTKFRMIVELIPFLKKFSKILKEHEIKLAHFNMLRSLLIYGLVFKLKGIPIIWHLRGDDYKSKLFDFLMKVGKYLSDKIIVVSKHIKNVFPNSPKCELVYNGLDVGEFDTQEFEYINKQFSIEENTITIVCVGTLVEKKGQIYLIRAIKKVDAIFSNIKVLIIGDAPEEGSDEYKKLLNSEVNKLGLSDKIIFTGWRDDVSKIFKSADIFVLTSLKEAFGRVTIEAMYSKLAIIATNSGGTPELIEEGKHGILVEPENVEELYRALIHLIENPDYRRKIGNLANKAVMERFTTKITASKIEQIYKELLQ